MTVTKSDINDEAAKKFEISLEKLHKLDIAKGYMELSYHVDSLRFVFFIALNLGSLGSLSYSKEALRMMNSSPRLALPPYMRLRNIVSALKETQPAAEGAASHLVNYVGKIACILRGELVKKFTDSFQRVLEKIKWPGRELNIAVDLTNEWTDGVELLLKVQEP